MGIALWGVLTYAIFTIKPEKPTLAEGINGGWLVAVVASHSIAALGARLAPGLTQYAPQALLFSLAMWLGGAMCAWAAMEDGRVYPGDRPEWALLRLRARCRREAVHTRAAVGGVAATAMAHSKRRSSRRVIDVSRNTPA